MQAALPHGQYGSEDSMAFVVTVANHDAVWNIFQAPICDTLIIFPLNDMTNSLLRLIPFPR